MKRFSKAQAFLATVLSVLVVCPLGCKKEEPQAKEIKIGAAMPLSGDGAVYGEPQRRAAQIAVDEINQKGGLLGKKVILLAQDDKAMPTEAVNIAHLFTTTSGVVAVIGYPNSGNAIAASKVLNADEMPYVATSPTNPVLTQQGFRNVFRFAPTDDAQGVSGAQFILHQLKVRAIAIMHDNASYGRGLASQVRDHFQSLGGQVLLFDALQPGEKDYKSILLKSAAFKPEVIFYGGMLPEGVILVRQAEELGIKTKFVFGDGCFDETFKGLASASCENVYISFLAPPWDNVPSASKFAEEYKARYGPVPSFAPYGYDAVTVVAEGIKRVNSTESVKIINAMHDPNFVVQGVTGRIQFGPDGQTPNKQFYFYTFDKQGKLVPYE